MTPDSKQPSPSEPLRFESPLLGAGDQLQHQQKQKSNNTVLWGIFALLLLLTIGVLFVLPRVMQPEAPPVAAPATTPADTEPAPFDEAKRLQARQQAQEVLQPLLELQETLQEQQVLLWDADAFNKASEQAKAGDKAYSSLQYEQALNLYQQAYSALQAISEGRLPKLNEQLSLGAAAITAGDSKSAEAAFTQALVLDANNAEASKGLAYAKVLDQVLALLAEAEQLQAANDFDGARSKYQAVLQLDSGNAVATAALPQLNTTQANANFATAMSRGFAALQAGNINAANAAFKQAEAMRPGSSEVKAALQQVSDQVALGTIATHINTAQAAEASEAWGNALAAWNAALGIDPNLVTAQEGQRRTNSRNNLDKFLLDTLANPYRLNDSAAYAQTQKVLQDATILLSPGPKLQQQLTEVQNLLTRIKIPVTVILQSDGLTAVTLYGVGPLGALTSHNLDLLPGRYVAVGVRPGYRDVRKEFEVSLDGTAVQLTIICSETI